MANRILKGPSREQKADATTLAAQEIIGREQALTAAKTERLRAQRLAHQAAHPAPEKKTARARKGS